MTDDELDALEAAAKAATPGPWKHYNYKGSDCVTVSGKVFLPRLEISVADTAFIAAANPAAVLELIAELRQARRERDWLVERMPNTQCPDGKAECDARVPTAGGKVCYSCLLCWLEAAKEATK